MLFQPHPCRAFNPPLVSQYVYQDPPIWGALPNLIFNPRPVSDLRSHCGFCVSRLAGKLPDGQIAHFFCAPELDELSPLVRPPLFSLSIADWAQIKHPFSNCGLTPGHRVGAYSDLFWEGAFSDPAINRVTTQACDMKYLVKAHEAINAFCHLLISLSVGGGCRGLPTLGVLCSPSRYPRKNSRTSSLSQQCLIPILKLFGSQSTPRRIPSLTDASVRPSIFARPATNTTSQSSSICDPDLFVGRVRAKSV